MYVFDCLYTYKHAWATIHIRYNWVIGLARVFTAVRERAHVRTYFLCVSTRFVRPNRFDYFCWATNDTMDLPMLLNYSFIWVKCFAFASPSIYENRTLNCKLLIYGSLLDLYILMSWLRQDKGMKFAFLTDPSFLRNSRWWKCADKNKSCNPRLLESSSVYRASIKSCRFLCLNFRQIAFPSIELSPNMVKM